MESKHRFYAVAFALGVGAILAAFGLVTGSEWVTLAGGLLSGGSGASGVAMMRRTS